MATKTVKISTKTIGDNISDDLKGVLSKSMTKEDNEILNEDATKKAPKAPSEKPKPCICAVKFQTKKDALFAISEKRDVILATIEENVLNKNGDATVKQVQRAFSRCKKSAKDNGMCWKHGKSNTPFVFDTLLQMKSTIVTDGNNDFFKKKGKLIKASANKKMALNPCVQECLTNKEFRDKVVEFCESLLNSKKKKYTLTLKGSGGNSKKPKKTQLVEQNQDASVEEGEGTKADEDTYVSENEASAEEDEASVGGESNGSENDEEIDCSEIQSTNGDTYYCDSNNQLYKPDSENGSAVPFAQLVMTKYKASPFHLKRNGEEKEKYYVAGTRFDFDDATYWRCMITNKAYQFEPDEKGLHNYMGMIKEKGGQLVFQKKRESRK